MKPTKQILENYGSYLGKHTFVFADGVPGVHYVTGRNEVEFRLEANGAGKSGLFSGMFWIVYGKSPRGQKGPELRNWFADGRMYGQLWFVIGKHEYRIVRSWHPNVLKLAQDGRDFEVVEQRVIDRVVGLSANLAQRTWFVGQFGPKDGTGSMFFDLGATDKLKVFSKLLDLDRWEDCSKKAAEWKSKYQAKVAECSVRMDVFKEPMRLAQAGCDSITQQSADHERRKKAIAKELQDKIDSAQTTRKTLRKRWEKIEQQAEEAKVVVNDTGRRASIKQEKLQAAQEVLRGLEKILTEANITKRLAIDEQTRLSKAKGKCPLCRQPIDPGHIEREQARLAVNLKLIKLDTITAITAVEEARGDVDHWLKICKKKQAEHEEAKAIRDGLVAKLNALGKDRTYWRDIRKAAIDELERHNSGVDPFAGMLKAKQEELEKVQKEVKTIQEDAQKFEQKFMRAHYWVQGFKKLRLFLIEDALAELQLEVNNCLSQLGLTDWTVEFGIDRETQTGTVQLGFQVFIRPPGRNDAVAWESWSGGETQRLRLAGTMGLSAIVLQYAGVQPGIEVWDEATNHMSQRGIDDLLDCLRQRAVDLRRQLWLIDHRTLDAGGFASVTNIVKDDAGSHIGKTEFQIGE